MPFAPAAPGAAGLPTAGLPTAWPGHGELLTATIGGLTASGPLAMLARPVRRLLASPAAADPRLPLWIRRAVLATLAAGILTATVAWWLGFAAAAAVVVADVMMCARTSPVIPARVRVTSAQRRTRRRLTRLSPSGYLSLHARRIPGTDSVIDHLVVGPAGVYSVDSQRWDRRLPVRATQGGRLYHGPFDQTGRLAHARWEASQVARLIGNTLGLPVIIRPAMVIYGPTVPWTVASISGVDVFCGRRLRKYLRHETCANRARRLSERQIELIHAVAAQVLPPAR
jgi:nuclease-like protein